MKMRYTPTLIQFPNNFKALLYSKVGINMVLLLLGFVTVIANLVLLGSSGFATWPGCAAVDACLAVPESYSIASMCVSPFGPVQAATVTGVRQKVSKAGESNRSSNETQVVRHIRFDGI